MLSPDSFRNSFKATFCGPPAHVVHDPTPNSSLGTSRSWDPCPGSRDRRGFLLAHNVPMPYHQVFITFPETWYFSFHKWHKWCGNKEAFINLICYLLHQRVSAWWESGMESNKDLPALCPRTWCPWKRARQKEEKGSGFRSCLCFALGPPEILYFLWVIILSRVQWEGWKRWLLHATLTSISVISIKRVTLSDSERWG